MMWWAMNWTSTPGVSVIPVRATQPNLDDYGYVRGPPLSPIMLIYNDYRKVKKKSQSQHLYRRRFNESPETFSHQTKIYRNQNGKVKERDNKIVPVRDYVYYDGIRLASAWVTILWNNLRQPLRSTRPCYRHSWPSFRVPFIRCPALGWTNWELLLGMIKKRDDTVKWIFSKYPSFGRLSKIHLFSAHLGCPPNPNRQLYSPIKLFQSIIHR